MFVLACLSGLVVIIAMLFGKDVAFDLWFLKLARIQLFVTLGWKFITSVICIFGRNEYMIVGCILLEAIFELIVYNFGRKQFLTSFKVIMLGLLLH